MYEVIVGEEKQTQCDTRAEATDAARELSENQPEQVVVTDAQGLLRMVYRRGNLENFVLETRGRPQRSDDRPH